MALSFCQRKSSAFLRGITSKRDGDSYCLNCFCSSTTEDALEKHENVSKDYDNCYVKMPDKDNNKI